VLNVFGTDNHLVVAQSPTSQAIITPVVMDPGALVEEDIPIPNADAVDCSLLLDKRLSMRHLIN